MSRLEPEPSFGSLDDERELGDSPLRLETTVHHDHPVTVVRDTEGHIVYPTYVPPGIESPTSGKSPTEYFPAQPSQEEHQQKEKKTQQLQQQQQQQQQRDSVRGSYESGRARSKTESAVFDTAARPSGKQWATDMAGNQQQEGGTLPPMPTMRRAGTNVSQLMWHPRALRPHNDNDSYDSSSSSSSSDEEDEEAQGSNKKHGKKKAKKHQSDPKSFRRFHVGNDKYRTKGKVSKRDGRLSISVHDMSNTGYLAKALGMAVKKVMPARDDEEANDKAGQAGRSRAGSEATTARDRRLSSVSTAAGPDRVSCPRLNIVIMVIGSRGDAQPFLKIGKVLKEQWGHRVRIATHPAFRDFVEQDSGLEFFSVGGDPSELMSFMVKNPGMIPTLETVKAGDIGRRRAAMAEMFGGFWRACINATDDERDDQNRKMMGSKSPFVADAIIANPPSFAHVHCAEALGIPLHLMFTFPYTPTQAFPHPLASIKKSNVDPGYTNWISYPLVEMMVWQGLGDLVNDFRTKTLGLDPVSTLWAPGATYRQHVPFTYLWSPGLVPKPEDWGDEVDVSGFVFLDLASSFKPPDPLTKFLENSNVSGKQGGGEDKKPLVYIGFGSIVVDDANRFTQMIFEAVELAGVRALVSKGWGGLGGEDLDVPEDILFLDNTPHDWLFPKVKACVIHGGAGTTAIALKCGKPTMIVPFFGDQHFWGSMVASSGAGPDPVPYKNLTAEKLAEGIKYCLTDEAREAVGEIAKSIEREGDGAENACKAFHRHLVLEGRGSMRCSILSDKVAAWEVKNSKRKMRKTVGGAGCVNEPGKGNDDDSGVRLSPMAAELAVARGITSWKKLRLLRHVEWNDFEGPGEPVTGLAGSIAGTVGGVFGGIGGVPYRIAKSARERKEKKKKRREKREKRRAEKDKEGDGSGPASGKATAGGKENQGDGDKNVKQPAPETEAADHATGATTAPAKSSGKTDDAKKDESKEGEEKKAETSNTKDDGNNNKRETPTRHDTQLTSSTVDPDENNPAEEFVTEVGRGAVKSAAALARAPMDLSLALAQGFHNAPRLYGDDTVRRPTRVTGIKSGLRAARHEFAYGIYDGWTGLVRLPVRGAREGGAKGFVKGVGMGATGFVLKDIAALIGPVGYTLKGVVKQVQRGGHKNTPKYVRRARMVQGEREVKALDERERRRREEEVIAGWDVMSELWDALVVEAEGGRKGEKGRKRRKIKRFFTVKGLHWHHHSSKGGGGKEIDDAEEARRREEILFSAFESVEAAKKAIEVLRSGQDGHGYGGVYDDGKHEDMKKGEEGVETRTNGERGLGVVAKGNVGNTNNTTKKENGHNGGVYSSPGGKQSSPGANTGESTTLQQQDKDGSSSGKTVTATTPAMNGNNGNTGKQHSRDAVRFKDELPSVINGTVKSDGVAV